MTIEHIETICHLLCDTEPAQFLNEPRDEYFVRWERWYEASSEYARELALRGEITTDHYKCLTKMHGLSPYFAGKILHASREKLSHHDIIEYYRRHPEIQNKTDAKLKQIGFIDDEERGIIEDLYNEIPDINTHFEWLRRNADSPLFVAEFGLWQGFDTRANIIQFYQSLLQDPDTSPERALEINEAIPIIQNQPINPALATRNYWNTYGKDITAKGWIYKNAFYAYVAHFLPVPREMGYEFVQRLRAGRVPDNLVFTQQTLRRVLNEQDIDPNMIDRYIYCSYRTLNQRYIQMLAKLGLIDEREIGERLQDIGFDPQSSKLLAHGLELQRRAQVAAEFHGWTASNILSKYKDHLLTKEQAIFGLKHLGATDQDIADAFEVISLHKSTEKKLDWKKTIEKGFKRGFYDASTAQQVLVNAGFSNQAATDIVELWQVQMTIDIHNPDARELVNAYIDGFMSQDDVATRLVRMNYSYESIGLMLATAYLKITDQEKKSDEQQQKQKEAAAKELAKQIKEQQKNLYRQARIKLNVAKAIERAGLLVMKQQAKDSAKVAKNILKLSTIVGLSNQKDATSRALLDIAQKAQKQIQDIKDKLAIDLASTTDKVAKAQMKNDANDKIASIKAQAQADAEKARQQQSYAQETAQEALTVGPVPPPTPSDEQVVAGEATTIVSDANATAAVETLAP